MNWETLKAKLLPKRGERTGSFLLPSVVIEMQPGFVAGARFDKSSRQVCRVAVRQLESGALEALPNRPNMAKQEVVRRAVGEVLEAVGNDSGRLGVLLPDPSVRVAILRFETLPDNRVEAEELVRWKMGSFLPFPPEEARVSYQVLSQGEQSVELLAMALRNSVVADYEAAFETVRAGPALILPATAALLPLLPAGSAGGQALVHVCSGSITTVVTVGENLRFWRNRVMEPPTAEGDGEVVREIARVVATCRDHLKTELDDVWVCTRPPSKHWMEKEVGEAAGRRVQRLTHLASHAGALPPAEEQIMETFGMTFAGLLENQN
jgi:hypothetical protein